MIEQIAWKVIEYSKWDVDAQAWVDNAVAGIYPTLQEAEKVALSLGYDPEWTLHFDDFGVLVKLSNSYFALELATSMEAHRD